MEVIKEEIVQIDNYHSIFDKLKKLHNFAKNNDVQDPSGSQGDENKLSSKRKTKVELDGLSDESALNSSNRTKRRRFSDSQEYSESTDNVEDFQRNKKYVISLSNLPGEWTYEQIKQYVTDECGVNVLMMKDSRTKRSDFQLRLSFNNEDHYRIILQKLRIKENEGKFKLNVEGESDNESTSSESTLYIGKGSPKRKTDSPNDDNVGCDDDVFGLNPDFLKKLDIEPPLVKWINVSNFRCDKSELRSIFEMAGNIVICAVIQSKQNYAKIMYSHPLEAVQAISMLNEQIFYGQCLKVTLDPMAELALPLPKGLQQFGLGLGAMGKPLRDVASEYNRFIKGKPSAINTSLFKKSGTNDDLDLDSSSTPGTTEDDIYISVPKIKNSPVSTPLSNLTNPTPTIQTQPPQISFKTEQSYQPNYSYTTSGQQCPYPPQPTSNPGQIQQTFQNPALFNLRNPHVSNFGTNFMPRGPTGPNISLARMMGPTGPTFPSALPAPNVPCSMPMSYGPRAVEQLHGLNAPPQRLNTPQRTSGHYQASNGLPLGTLSSVPSVIVLKGKDSVTLNISNLPPRVTFASICGKLAKVGQVVSLEFTIPGCAVVKFSSPAEAERCFQYYSPSRHGQELGMVE
ncbi:unnamed protein product [Leptosia nina]|uniref:RRM domain-containing protein n=1 Tax=Leptosia nina TaxID=320188 RepID=A0AAV1IYW8_9NEOP